MKELLLPDNSDTLKMVLNARHGMNVVKAACKTAEVR